MLLEHSATTIAQTHRIIVTCVHPDTVQPVHESV